MSDLDTILERLQPETGVLVGGSWVRGGAGTFDVINPADRSVVARVANADRAQAIAAVAAADEAGRRWRSTSPRERSDALRGAFETMRRDSEELAALISAENGKPTADALAEVGYAAEFLRWFSEEAVRPGGDYGEAPAGGVRTIVTHRPVGVAALVTPWNFPAAMATRKIGPALAAGCTVVLKPAPETPLTALAIARILQELGVPDGVVNVIPSTDSASVVTAWLGDDRVRKLSFTGSTGVGRLLLRQAADRIVNSSMELGGNAPFVVTASADLDAAVAGAMTAKFRGSGQACTAANRFYVHEDIAFEFIAKCAARVASLRVGPASDPSSDIGPLISGHAVDAAENLVEDALERGARVAARADVPGHLSGHFLAPTLLADVPNDAAIVQREIFAPVAPVITWRDEQRLLEMLNGSEQGLAAYVYDSDLRRAMQLAERMDAGMVAINRGLVAEPSAPFGGVKQSGMGREGAREGLAAYQETQYLSLDWAEASAGPQARARHDRAAAT